MHHPQSGPATSARATPCTKTVCLFGYPNGNNAEINLLAVYYDLLILSDNENSGAKLKPVKSQLQSMQIILIVMIFVRHDIVIILTW